MKFTINVVVYLRVSTKKQANDPTSLPAQRKLVLDFCAAQGWNVVEIFVDAGETAYKVDKATDRPKFRELLQYCSAHKREIDYVVFESVSRWSRKILHSELAIEQIKKSGVGWWSVTDSGINSNDANGRYNLQRQVVEAENFSRQLSRKMRDRALAAFLSGRVARAAILGYKNGDRMSTGANVIPHPQQSKLWVKAFELLATRSHTQQQVRQMMNTEGLQNRKGKPVSAQTFNKSIRNPFYCGWLVSEKHGKRVKGLHVPLISEELFNEVQRVLNGKKPSAAPKRKLNPAFPLKNFVRCAVCATKLTGGFTTKKSGSRYGYYFCRKAGCRAVKSIPTVFMDADFKQLLKRLKPTEDVLLMFPKIAARLWSETAGDVEKRRARLTAQLTQAKGEKAELLRMRLRGELTPEEFEDSKSDYSQRVDSLTQELQMLESASAQQEAFMRFVEVRLMDISGAWEKADAENRYRVQTLLFSDGLSYDPKSNSLNSAKSTLFSVLNQVEASIYQNGVPDGI